MNDILFRLDFNNIIGMGHLMRCLTLGEKFKKLEINVKYIVSNDSIGINSSDFDFYKLRTSSKDMIEEIGELKTIVEHTNPLLFILDSYEYDEVYLKRLDKLNIKILIIDDYCRLNYENRVVMNYNLYAHNFQELKRTENFLGVDFLPLREQFLVRKININILVKCVFITAGGTDYLNITDFILSNIYSDKYIFHVVVGELNQNYNALVKKNCANKNVFFYQGVSNISEIMLKCDIAISASGYTLYEIASLGIPIINFSFVDNQILIAKSFDENKISQYIGDIRELNRNDSNRLKTTFSSLSEDYDLRTQIRKIQDEIFDACLKKSFVDKLLK